MMIPSPALSQEGGRTAQNKQDGDWPTVETKYALAVREVVSNRTTNFHVRNYGGHFRETKWPLPLWHERKNEEEPTMIEVPIWQKANLTVEEAAAYSGVGKGKLRAISDDESCDFVLWIGTKRLIKRKKLDEYLEKAFSI